MAEPKNTSEAQWALSLTIDRAAIAAILYNDNGINKLSLYSDANTVAIANADDECPEGKDRSLVDKPGPTQVSCESESLGLCLCPENLIACVNIPETTKLSKLSKPALRALLFSKKWP